MQKAGPYFNKIMGFTPATRAEAEVTLYPNNNGYLLEVTDKTISYQYFVAGENPITCAITIPFNGVYGVKKFKGISIDDTFITIHGEEDKTVEFSIANADDRKFRCFATTSIDAFTNGLNGCSCFAKKGSHTFNKNVYLDVHPNELAFYSATDISIMRNRLECKTGNNLIVGISNEDISTIKGWLNYANNPKNGTGEVLYLSLYRNHLKLQTATCSIIVSVTSQMDYKYILDNFNKLLDYPYYKEPNFIDWESILPETKATDKAYITVADGEAIRTWVKSFVEFAMLECYETYKLNTKCTGYMLEMDNGFINSTVLLMLKSC